MSEPKLDNLIDNYAEKLLKDYNEFMQVIKNYATEHLEKLKKFDKIINSKTTTKLEKLEAIVAKRFEMLSMSNGIIQTSNTLTFYNITLLLKLVNISVENIEKQLTESGVIEKVKAVEDAKKIIEDILRKIKSDFEKVEKSKAENLWYVK